MNTMPPTHVYAESPEASQNDVEALKKALHFSAKGSGYQPKQEELNSLLKIHAAYNNHDCVDLLLQVGAHVNSTSALWHVHQQDPERAALHEAILWHGDHRMIKLLLEAGADVNQKGKHQGKLITPQKLARDKKRLDIEPLLISEESGKPRAKSMPSKPKTTGVQESAPHHVCGVSSSAGGDLKKAEITDAMTPEDMEMLTVLLKRALCLVKFNWPVCRDCDDGSTKGLWHCSNCGKSLDSCHSTSKRKREQCTDHKHDEKGKKHKAAAPSGSEAEGREGGKARGWEAEAPSADWKAQGGKATGWEAEAYSADCKAQGSEGWKDRKQAEGIEDWKKQAKTWSSQW